MPSADLLARRLASAALPDDLDAVRTLPIKTRVRLRRLHSLDHLLDLHHVLGEMLPRFVNQLVEQLRLRETDYERTRLRLPESEKL